MRPPVLFGIATLSIMLTGCLDATAPATPLFSDDEEVADPSPPLEVILVDRKPSMGVAFDVECRLGGAPVLAREAGAFLTSGHTTLRFVVNAPPTSTGVQIGYQLDGGEIAWLPTAFAEEAVHEVPIPANASEEDGARWTFYLSQNVKAAPRGCYTGATLMEESIRVSAI